VSVVFRLNEQPINAYAPECATPGSGLAQSPLACRVCLIKKNHSSKRSQPSTHTMCRPVNERARVLLQLDGPLGLPKWRPTAVAQHLQPPAQKRGAGWAVITIQIARFVVGSWCGAWYLPEPEGCRKSVSGVDGTIICCGSTAQLCTWCWPHLHTARTQYYDVRLAERL
jgi:hypothetical protein